MTRNLDYKLHTGDKVRFSQHGVNVADPSLIYREGIVKTPIMEGLYKVKWDNGRVTTVGIDDIEKVPE